MEGVYKSPLDKVAGGRDPIKYKKDTEAVSKLQKKQTVYDHLLQLWVIEPQRRDVCATGENNVESGISTGAEGGFAVRLPMRTQRIARSCLI